MAEAIKATAAAAAVVATTNEACIKAPKRRNERNILTFYEKIAVIRYYDETNISRNSLAKMFHCCATQIRRILEKKKELMLQLATLSEADASIIIEEMTRKRRKFEMSAISFILHQWVERCRVLRLRKCITNQTLKETALKMSAILNLPGFRPSYRWLNRFRGKYKYNAQDLSVSSEEGVAGELAVEDIIIEYKDSLPSFMQKEIAAITASTKMDNRTTDASLSKVSNPTTTASLDHNAASLDHNEDNATDGKNLVVCAENLETSKNWEADLENSNSNSLSSTSEEDTTMHLKVNVAESLLNVVEISSSASPSTSILLDNIFPHLAVMHQFALLNSDIRALELISQLGVHMQTQAANGVYKQQSLATLFEQHQPPQLDMGTVNGGIYADIDDIVLME